jgi:GT2 family glycosyltransferase
MVSGWGYDRREAVEKDQRFALAVLNPIAFDTIGLFDGNFWPIYFEDVDWCRRAELAGLPELCVPDTCIVHAGSKTLYTHTNMETHHRQFAANQAYYVRKWGGMPGEETFTIPFNDPRFTLRIDPWQHGPAYSGVETPMGDLAS